MSTKIKDLRDVTESENKRINERLTTLLQCQGLLFAALSFGWEKNYNLSIVITIVGIISTISIGGMLILAILAFYKLVKAYHEIPENERELEGPIIGYDNAFPKSKNGVSYIRRNILHYGIVLPVLLTLAWVYILIIITFNLE